MPMLVFSGVAQASSDYDSLLHTTPSLFVYTDGAAKSQKMDISQSWFDSLGQTYAKRVAQNIGWPTNFMSELNDIISFGGSLGVFMQVTSDGNMISVIGSRDPHAYCGFVGDADAGSYNCTSHVGYGYVSATYFTHSSFGGNGCMGSYMYLCSDDGMNIYTAPVVQTGTAGYTFLSMPDAGLSIYKFYYMHFDLTYPSGYAGEMIPTSPPPAKYVAMGDSYSSGEANAPYEAGTDQDSDLCHRSTMAYPRLVQSSLNLGATAFVACSGAVSSQIINEYNHDNTELPQAAFVSSETELVTITIGGNDVGFGDVLKTCTLSTTESGTTEEKHQIEHDSCIQAIDDAQSNAQGALQNKLEGVFAGLRSLGSGNLQVVVAGYPNLFPVFGDISGSCVWGNGNINTSGRTVASDEVQASRQLHDDLDATIAAAVTATADDHIHYVDPSSVFAGHELCRSDPWFYNVVPHLDTIDQKGSYHPNSSGQTAYANVIKQMINSF